MACKKKDFILFIKKLEEREQTPSRLEAFEAKDCPL